MRRRGGEEKEREEEEGEKEDGEDEEEGSSWAPGKALPVEREPVHRHLWSPADTGSEPASTPRLCRARCWLSSWTEASTLEPAPVPATESRARERHACQGEDALPGLEASQQRGEQSQRTWAHPTETEGPSPPAPGTFPFQKAWGPRVPRSPCRADTPLSCVLEESHEGRPTYSVFSTKSDPVQGLRGRWR
ncbi:hypothetical protein P7K49_009093 [Saguinus oedipus]|uniref:Uncharacterized protein n=1 Tax=Saguinus oedipus TaxID=9490 RepID=A0ABQ9VZK1_SAGOE|nr:hypothetical protein P7K49_009093 [Saguinus oedipus]